MFGLKLKSEKNTQIPMKIFIVEDSKIFLQTLRAKLNQLFSDKAKIKGYTDSTTFLEDISEKPEIIIMDYYLGKESEVEGEELIQKIKKSNPNAFLIVLTGEENLEIAKKCFALGVNSYIVKTLTSIEKIVDEIHYKINLFKKV